MLVILVFAAGTTVQAGEIIYKNDIVDKVVPKEELVKTADNIVVMVDSSASMAAEDKTFHKPYYELEKEALKAGFERLPDLGYNVGVCQFTPWEVLFPMQKFDAATAEEALNKMPAEPAGKTPLLKGLDELEAVLKGLSGKTFVYLFSDGGFDKGTGSISPGDKTTRGRSRPKRNFPQLNRSAADLGSNPRLRVSGAVHHRNVDISSEKIGEFLGLDSHDRRLLRRDGDVHQGSVLYRFKLDQKNRLTPEFILGYDDRKGDARTNTNVGAQVTYGYLGDPIRLILNGSSTYADFDKKTRSTARPRRTTPMGWEPAYIIKIPGTGACLAASR
jgi:Protein of unknown function (DUF2860)/von Willebrand factor type A domain